MNFKSITTDTITKIYKTQPNQLCLELANNSLGLLVEFQKIDLEVLLKQIIQVIQGVSSGFEKTDIKVDLVPKVLSWIIYQLVLLSYGNIMF